MSRVDRRGHATRGVDVGGVGTESAVSEAAATGGEGPAAGGAPTGGGEGPRPRPFFFLSFGGREPACRWQCAQLLWEFASWAGGSTLTGAAGGWSSSMATGGFTVTMEPEIRFTGGKGLRALVIYEKNLASELYCASLCNEAIENNLPNFYLCVRHPSTNHLSMNVSIHHLSVTYLCTCLCVRVSVCLRVCLCVWLPPYPPAPACCGDKYIFERPGRLHRGRLHGRWVPGELVPGHRVGGHGHQRGCDMREQMQAGATAGEDQPPPLPTSVLANDAPRAALCSGADVRLSSELRGEKRPT